MHLISEYDRIDLVYCITLSIKPSKNKQVFENLQSLQVTNGIFNNMNYYTHITHREPLNFK